MIHVDHAVIDKPCETVRITQSAVVERGLAGGVLIGFDPAQRRRAGLVKIGRQHLYPALRHQGGERLLPDAEAEPAHVRGQLAVAGQRLQDVTKLPLLAMMARHFANGRAPIGIGRLFHLRLGAGLRTRVAQRRHRIGNTGSGLEKAQHDPVSQAVVGSCGDQPIGGFHPIRSLKMA